MLYTRIEIRKRADNLRRDAGVVGRIPVPVEHIAQTLGNQVVQFSPSADTDSERAKAGRLYPSGPPFSAC